MSDYILRITLLESPWNVNLMTSDFAIDTETPLRLKRSGAFVVLFHGEDDVSVKALSSWSKVSQVTIGPTFGSCNLRAEKVLASKILDTNNTNPSLRWTNTLRVPYILAYYNTWPLGKYTGPLDDASISNWSLTIIGGIDQAPTPSLTTTVTTSVATTNVKPAETEVTTIPKTL